MRLRTDEKKKKYRRNPLALPSKELTNFFFYFFIYLVRQTTSLSLLPLPHSCIPSSSPRSRFFCRFQLKLPRTFSFFLCLNQFLCLSLLSLWSHQTTGGGVWEYFFCSTNERPGRKSKFKFSHVSLDNVFRLDQLGFFKQQGSTNLTQHTRKSVFFNPSDLWVHIIKRSQNTYEKGGNIWRWMDKQSHWTK